MKNNKFILLEKFDPSLDYSDKEVISLDPAVSFSLDKNNIKYKIIEDYDSEKKLCLNEENYFSEQLEWFSAFDSFLKNNISYCRNYDIPLASANYLRIKYFVDSVVIYCKLIFQFFQANPKITEITYVSGSNFSNSYDSVFEFKLKNRRVFGELLELFCAKFGITFIHRIVENQNLSLQRKSILDGVRGRAFLKSNLKLIKNLFKYDKLKSLSLSSDKLNSLNVLFMHLGSPDIDIPLRELIINGARVYAIEKEKILQESSFFRTAVAPDCINDGTFNKINEECAACAEKLNDDPSIISWISNKCSFDASKVAISFLRNFVSYDCAHILADAEKMYLFYKNKKISYVFARSSTEKNSVAPLIAAKYRKAAKSVCVGHACFAKDSEVFAVFETETFNYLLARDEISEDYFKFSLKNRYKAECNLLQSAHYLKNLQNKLPIKISMKKKKEKIIYAEKKFSDKVKCFNNLTYPLAWYYEFQKHIVDCFGSLKNFEFLYKHAKGQAWAEESILRYINDRKYSNLNIGDGYFADALQGADRVIVDFPSGAMFEAAVSGKPVLCIYPDYLKILPRAKRVFGKSLQPFSCVEEAVSTINNFVYSNRDDYVVKMSLIHKDFMPVFKNLLSEQENAG